MKKNNKSNTALYAYLDASGVFEKGTSSEIEQAKARYWKEYKRKWKRERKQTHKSFEISFDLKEQSIINRQAKKYRIEPIQYIKQAALADKENIVDRVAIVEIRELVIMHHTAMLNFFEEDTMTPITCKQLIEQASQIETKLLDFLSSLK